MVPNTPTNLLDLRQLGLLLAVLTEIPRMDKADILGLVRLRLRYLRLVEVPLHFVHPDLHLRKPLVHLGG